MKYEKTVKATFIERENRFIARVRLQDGSETKVHVKNTGRCRELLVPGCTVFLEDFMGRMGTRKMQYSLIAVEKDRPGSGKLLINMDSQAPNRVVQEALEAGRLKLPGISGHLTLIKPEKTYGKSRFDFYVESGDEKAFIEVKGVTLEEAGFARFPDAPTERGLKHINELIEAAENGYRAFIVFVIQMKEMHLFGPNYETQPEFGETLIKAEKAGVKILACDCKTGPDSLELDEPVAIDLTNIEPEEIKWEH
ncbi:MAG: DNA/RNA nuclease SfsA [Clostridia bacterium]|nr:DNA/RNA nuclease SfsA [Clostridia bacterium]